MQRKNLSTADNRSSSIERNSSLKLYTLFGLLSLAVLISAAVFPFAAESASNQNPLLKETNRLSSDGSGRKLGGPSQYDIIGPVGSESFASQTLVLPNGNIVITDPKFDLVSPEQIDVGAVHLYNGATGVLISTLTGSFEFDGVGTQVVLLANSNFAVRSQGWDRGSALSAGAVTFCNGTTGCNGPVSEFNSLVGTKTDDFVGDSVVLLSTGDYVVGSLNWDNSAVVNAGAVTHCNGTTGCVGEVTPANSLIGQSGSLIGWPTALSNGAYTVSSPRWRNGTAASAGAVTFCNGPTGCSGMEVSTANSLYGIKANDNVGCGDGSSDCQPLVLTNGNYVISSRNWDNGTIVNVGAVTFCNGTTGCVPGPVTTSNSMVGSKASDFFTDIEEIVALTNGNYVIGFNAFDNGAVNNAGSVTFCDGITGCTGIVSSTNSLVGTATNDAISQDGIVALPNGNYVIASSQWDNGAITSVGAVTFCNGTTGCTPGPVTTANSLVGSTISDGIGDFNDFMDQKDGAITVLANGNFTVASPVWDSPTIPNVGAVTLCSGTTGCNGSVVSAANSLTGTQQADNVGLAGTVALTNGNYVVLSPFWDYPSLGNAGVGAVTLCTNPVTGCTGVVTLANSLTGRQSNDNVGSFGIALTNGNYVVSGLRWNGLTGAADRGAVKFCDGVTGCAGVTVSEANSLHGSTLDDHISGNASGAGDFFSLRALEGGHYAFRSQNWNNGPLVDAGAVTFGDATGNTVGAITGANSVRGNVAGSGAAMNYVYDTVNDQMVVGRPFEKIVTLFRPYSGPPPPTPTPTPTPSISPTPTPTPVNCTWVADTVLPAPVVNGAMTSVGGSIYSFGGFSNGTVTTNSYKFDGTSWTPIAPFPELTRGMAAVSDGTDIYIMGGLRDTGLALLKLRRYNVATNTYTDLAPFGDFTWNHAAVFLNGKIYKLGGNGGATGSSTSNHEIYDIATNTWTPGAAMFYSVSFPAAFTDGTYIYAAGGLIDGSSSDGYSNKAYRYNPASGSWNDSIMPDLPTPRWGTAATFFNGNAVLAGGYTGASSTLTSTVTSWHPETNSWRTTYPDALASRGISHGVILNGSLHALAGRTTTGTDLIGSNNNQKLTCTGGSTPTPTPTNTPTATPTGTPTATPTPAGFEGDVAPRPSGDGVMLSTDVTQLRRFVSGLDTPNVATNEVQRADCAPRTTLGDGSLTSGDVVQGRRYTAGLDPLTPSGGSTAPSMVPERMAAIFDEVYSYFFGRELRVGEATIDKSTVTIPIELTPQGDEVAVSFTLEYDDTILTNAHIVLGEAAPIDSTLTVNTTESGRIGILIDSNRSMAASAMPVSILSVTFDIVAKTDQQTAISLTDGPAARSVSDGDANLLPVTYRDGLVKIAARP